MPHKSTSEEEIQPELPILAAVTTIKRFVDGLSASSGASEPAVENSRPAMPAAALSPDVPKIDRLTGIKPAIVWFETRADNGTMTEADSQAVQARLDALVARRQNSPGYQKYLARAYELQALLHFFRGGEQDARAFLEAARAEFPSGETFVSELGRNWLSELVIATQKAAELEFSSRHTGRTRRSTKIAAIICTAIAVLAYVAATTAPYVEQQYVLSNAPVMLSEIAEDAGMSKAGKLHFYQSEPTVVNDNEFLSQCGDLSPDYLGQGCYVYRPGYMYGDIYIRDMPVEFQDSETVTGAHEMLHAAYAQLLPAERDRISSLLLEFYNDPATSQGLKDRMSVYRVEDQDILVGELHSILATEISVLPDPLHNYYSQYFDNRQKVVALEIKTANLFTAREETLAALEKSIDNKQTAADNLYGWHEHYMAAGDIFSADDYYRRYTAAYTDLDAAINTYNGELAAYQQMEDIYLGKKTGTLAAD